MQQIKQFAIKETVSELRRLQKQYPSKFKLIQMLIILKQQGSISKYAVAEQIGSTIVEGIEHSKTQVRHPQTNGICERLHRTMQEEFYAIAFREKLYDNLDDLQRDLDEWMTYYNQERAHSGRYCYGKTSMQTFKKSIILAQQKLIRQHAPAA